MPKVTIGNLLSSVKYLNLEGDGGWNVRAGVRERLEWEV